MSGPDRGARRLRLLIFTTLFPNAEQPNHGVFVLNRLRHLLASGVVDARVLAPVPWFPSAAPRFADWGRYARVPHEEMRDGIAVMHPRYPVIPRFGMSIAPALLAAAGLRAARRLRAQGFDFDAIDAHYFYPDGVAAARIGRALGRPVVVTARGTDINLIPRYAIPRRQIQAAAREAAGIIAVSEALKGALVGLGVPAERVRVLRNGVDTALFHPGDRAASRAAFGLTGPVLISVGHLIERKGHDRVIAAIAGLPDASLLIVGEGPERGRLESEIARLGLGARVRLLGAVPHRDLPALYAAADVLVLASTREGWANVLLEAMACGTPVVVSDAWGNPEVVRDRVAGRIASTNTPSGLAQAVRDLLADPPSRAATRAYAEGFGWEATTQGQIALFHEILNRPASRA